MNDTSINLRVARREGFTLVELLVVMVIIAILLGFILSAAMDASRRAEERATQSLITKLETGLNDRFDALLQFRPVPNYAHGYLSAIYSTLAVDKTQTDLTYNPIGMIPPPVITTVLNGNPTYVSNPAVLATERAQVFAWYDYIKSEMPDVFYVQNKTGPYPINFAAIPFPGTPTDPNSLGHYILPLGNSIAGPYVNGGFGDGNVSNPTLGFAGSGIYGASYTAAAGLYKNLGYLASGYDGVDNDGNGAIDEYNEGVCHAPNWTTQDSNVVALVTTHLQSHTHNTARAEMLYALLVEGAGPLGSVFNRDDFTDKEVRDTDSDGLPEFVDAWGQPIQFFRWPIFYHSDLQRGQKIMPDPTTANTWDLYAPYLNMFEAREQDPLDLNQQLMAPGWYSTQGSGGIAANNNPQFSFTAVVPSNASHGVVAFEALFHSLSEPYPSPGGATFWDRGTTYPYRRAFYSKFLVLSGGPDQQPGVFLYSDAAMSGFVAAGDPYASPYLIANENNAMQFGLDLFGSSTSGFEGNVSISTSTFTGPSSGDPTNPNSYDLQQSAQDDISNHNLQAVGGIGGSG